VRSAKVELEKETDEGSFQDRGSVRTRCGDGIVGPLGARAIDGKAGNHAGRDQAGSGQARGNQARHAETRHYQALDRQAGCQTGGCQARRRQPGAEDDGKAEGRSTRNVPRELRDKCRRVRRGSDEGVGAERRRSLLQPRQVRVFRRDALLPRRAELHGAVRDARRSEDQLRLDEANLADEPVVQSNKRGFITFAKRGAPNSRSNQLFINFGDNARLDSQGFAPFGQVVSGMEVVDKINAEYGEAPEQELITAQGNAYLTKAFPRLDYIKKATIMKPAPPPPPAKK
jgi:cyclophilin family peptidyl-prolyl cis-trans isomerase